MDFISFALQGLWLIFVCSRKIIFNKFCQIGYTIREISNKTRKKFNAFENTVSYTKSTIFFHTKTLKFI